jgi:hypothetical protein
MGRNDSGTAVCKRARAAILAERVTAGGEYYMSEPVIKWRRVTGTSPIFKYSFRDTGLVPSEAFILQSNKVLSNAIPIANRGSSEALCREQRFPKETNGAQKAESKDEKGIAAILRTKGGKGYKDNVAGYM